MKVVVSLENGLSSGQGVIAEVVRLCEDRSNGTPFGGRRRATALEVGHGLGTLGVDSRLHDSCHHLRAS